MMSFAVEITYDIPPSPDKWTEGRKERTGESNRHESYGTKMIGGTRPDWKTFTPLHMSSRTSTTVQCKMHTVVGEFYCRALWDETNRGIKHR